MTRAERYKEYLLSPVWIKIKADIIQVRGGKCEYCGRKKIVMHVHHLTYDNIFHEEPEDLVLLCPTCHAREHGIIKARKRVVVEYTKTPALGTVRNKKLSPKKRNVKELNLYRVALTIAVKNSKGKLPSVDGVFHTEFVNGAVHVMVEVTRKIVKEFER